MKHKWSNWWNKQSSFKVLRTIKTTPKDEKMVKREVRLSLLRQVLCDCRGYGSFESTPGCYQESEGKDNNVIVTGH